MNSPEDAVWFVGDLSDPWVVSIAGELARYAGIVQLHCPGDLPDRPFDRERPPSMIIIHRQRLRAVDAQRLKAYRDVSVPETAPAIYLCISPYVRFEELERWSGLADDVISEATAAEILPRHIARLGSGPEARTRRSETTDFSIEVLGTNHDLNQALAEACETAGYRVCQTSGAAARRSSARAERLLTLMDVPVLEPDWSDRLQRVARENGPVIALMGFADRESVDLAKAHGAVACLDLPYHVDDLIDLIDRTAHSLSIERWPIAVRTEPAHRLPPPPRRRKPRSETPETVLPWSDREKESRVDRD